MDSREHKDIPPEGHLVDYMLFGGIYRNVWLKILNDTHIKDVYFVVDKLQDSVAEISITTTIAGKEISNGKILTEVINKEGVVLFIFGY